MHPATPHATWRTSSHSGANGDCVQVTTRTPALIAIRDSKNPEGPELALTTRRWRIFISTLKNHTAS